MQSSVSRESGHTGIRYALRIAGRSLLVIVAVLLAVVLILLSMIFVLTRGPSDNTKELFVLSVKGSSAAGFLADIFLPQEEVNRILKAQEDAKNSMEGIKTDPSLIDIKPHDNENTSSPAQTDVPDESGIVTDLPIVVPTDPHDGITVSPVKMPSFNGTMLIIDDPLRVIMGTPDSYGENSIGMTLQDLVQKHEAIAGINGGGFYDPNGMGNGGIPMGLVISYGKMLWGSPNEYYWNVMGIDADGILHVGTMTGQEAIDAKIQHACSFGAGPTLIINGQPCNEKADLGGGRADRTAIGQRSDGAILMLVTNGRQIGCLGATYDDIVNVMLQYGAVNAAALDGGSSTLMLYDGKAMNTSSLIFGGRTIATSFLVK